MKDTERKLTVARGEEPADLVFRNGRIINLLSMEIHEGDVAVSEGRIVGIGAYEGHRTVDLQGRYLAPSFIDGHIHVESTMLTMAEFARAVVPHGTGAVVVDPHEYANVLGVRGIDYLLEDSRNLPLDVFIMIPSCVPATGLETSGARITAADMAPYVQMDRVAGIAEMMNFPGVYLGRESELEKIALGKGKEVDGHAPRLGGNLLNAYILAGVHSDHECTTIDEAREKLRRGMHILLREGTTERNLRDLLPLVTPANADRFSFASDDRHPHTLMDEGHIDHHVREAISFGIDPLTAYRMASLNTARHYRLKNRGAVAPRCWADLVVLDDMERVEIHSVYKRGEPVAERDTYLVKGDNTHPPPETVGRMNVSPLEAGRFRIAAGKGKMKVIEIVPGQIVTRTGFEAPSVRDGMVVTDPNRDLLKLAVIERHHATGNVGLGIVRGFGLKSGALASTVAHDAHNLIVIGVEDEEMLVAARALIDAGGGLCVAHAGEVAELFPLPVAGLVSDQPLDVVRRAMDRLRDAALRLGCVLPDPFMTLSFLALSPIPELKVTDLGLVDATDFTLTSLFDE